MKFKVYASILVGFLLMLSINSAGKIIGERLKINASKEIVNLAGSYVDQHNVDGGVGHTKVGAAEAQLSRLALANREVSEKYQLFFVLSLIIQALLMVAVAIFTGNYAIRLVSRSVVH